MWKSIKSKPLYFFLAFLLLLFFVFRSLIGHIQTNLIDWYDYPFVVWVFSQNIDHFLGLDIANIFQSNILYPYKYTLLLSENFMLPSLLAVPFFALTQNIILSFNIVFLTTFIINYLAAFLLWKSYIKDNFIAFLGSLLLVFSPIFHFELSHYQMHVYWPFLFCLYFTKRAINKFNSKDLIWAGIFLTAQFLSNMYFSVFLVATLVLFFVTSVYFKGNILEHAKKLTIILAVFFLTASPFIAGHIRANKEVSVTREYGEAVQYSAHLTDYVFSGGIKSVLHQSSAFDKWNSFNKHVGTTFPGFFITFFALAGLFLVKKKERSLSINIDFDSTKLFFTLVVLTGFVLSLGPRLNVNGVFAHIPLPYDLFMKFVPLFDSLRVSLRWSYLLYFGLIYLCIRYLQSIKITPLLSFILLFFFVLEYIPINLTTTSESYIRVKDNALKEMCLQNNYIVLEIPVTHFDAGSHIAEGLNYISTTQLASTYHKCKLVNGYSSYDLPSLFAIKDDIYLSAVSMDTKRFVDVVRETGASVISYNSNFVPKEFRKEYDLLVRESLKHNLIKEIEPGLYQLPLE